MVGEAAIKEELHPVEASINTNIKRLWFLCNYNHAKP